MRPAIPLHGHIMRRGAHGTYTHPFLQSGQSGQSGHVCHVDLAQHHTQGYMWGASSAGVVVRLLVYSTGQLALGSKVAAGAPLPLNPLLAAGWAALLANALNCIPVGEISALRLQSFDSPLFPRVPCICIGFSQIRSHDVAFKAVMWHNRLACLLRLGMHAC